MTQLLGDATIKTAYAPDTFRRLQRLKNRYDHSNLFRFSPNITPTGTS
jgi:Berberine and berberine like